MITLNENNFNEYFISTYSEINEDMESTINYINQHLKLAKKELIKSPVNYLYNAYTSSIKYFKNNNINYTGNYVDNPESIFMLSTETYLVELYTKAYLNLLSFSKEIDNRKNELKGSLKFQLILKLRLATKSTLDNYLNNILEDSSYLQNYNNLIDELINFDVEKTLPIALKNYIPLIKQEIKTGVFLFNEDDNDEYKSNEFYKYIISKAIFTLKENSSYELFERVVNSINEDNNTKTLKK